ncbi:ribonuclease HI / DNA polymerase-3 subunit epsilon [Moraxella cuniculi DSM 21768]|uniref:Ribonuclease H n=1 Tax=Moraxella cuniculi DSM 21768 TaxID=1122245 RepID=A0A1N7EGM7_9GAMM|nr:DNA polymerase III subunit epsilon [Moraxella cuniculi]OOS07300.1 DNA polymerase III subunit epsilon [Moraxella cuniculi]SIR87204.1 ribonuclease HI / DNA polymerase-3 subunit epsilon [Moraxella cuniculi DSM 21768]
METIIAYTDGACKGNGKQGASAGGYGVHVQFANGDVQNFWGGEADTTNNRMELMAAIVALQNTPQDAPLQLWTDSGYVKDGITKWIANWKSRGWKKADGKPVLNQQLWQQLDTLCQNRSIDWQWIKGHAGHAGNEMADKLANLGVHETGHELIPADGTNAAMPTSQSTTNQTNMEKTTMQSTSQYTHNNEQNPAYDGDTSRKNPDFWPVLPAPNLRGAPERQLIMDTETTGFNDQSGDRIVEVGIVEMVGRKFTGNKLHVYINPEITMDDEVIRVHGISNEFVSDKPKFAEVAELIYEFMVDSEIIAHNAGFDMRFLKMEFDRVGLTDFSDRVTVTDTLALAKQMYPGQKNSLDALVKRLDVGKKDRTFHGALLDSEILAEVYLAMTGGQINLAIDEEQSATVEQNTQGLHFANLSQLASLLNTSASDHQADALWREKTLK